ncbi:uncharacterized protein [Euwallacea fornicatus]|uniref:uncharacterized protein n=1 Tax=Euwallacea fornicatus TaxID=995702 RepID=UPI00338DC277
MSSGCNQEVIRMNARGKLSAVQQLSISKLISFEEKSSHLGSDAQSVLARKFVHRVQHLSRLWRKTILPTSLALGHTKKGAPFLVRSAKGTLRGAFQYSCKLKAFSPAKQQMP